MNSRFSMAKSRLLVLALTLLVNAADVYAINATWSGAGSNDNWSNSANWSNGSVAVSGDFAHFDGAGIRRNVATDANVYVARLNFLGGASSYVISGNAIGIDERITANGGLGSFNQINADVGFSNQQLDKSVGVLSGKLALNGILNLPGSQRRLDLGVDADSVLELGQISGSALFLYFYGGGSTVLRSTSSFTGPVAIDSGHTLTVQRGVTLTNADLWTVNAATLALETGAGLTGPVQVESGGTLALQPIDGSGSAYVRTLTMASGSTLRLDVSNLGESVRLNLGTFDSVQLSGAEFEFNIPWYRQTSYGQAFHLLAPMVPVTGTFANLPEGAMFVAANGRLFQISYAGGVSGVDVVVTDADPSLFYDGFE